MRFQNKLLHNLRREASDKKEDLRRDWGDEFYECIKDIAEHPVVLRMKLYPHHGHTSCYQHCLHVAYYNYVWCRFFQLDARSAARGGMLHDLFLYDWHTHAARTGDHFHGMTHPKCAFKHAKKFFELNYKEEDIILSHMWPVTLFRVPRTKEVGSPHLQINTAGLWRQASGSSKFNGVRPSCGEGMTPLIFFRT